MAARNLWKLTQDSEAKSLVQVTVLLQEEMVLRNLLKETFEGPQEVKGDLSVHHVNVS